MIKIKYIHDSIYRFARKSAGNRVERNPLFYFSHPSVIINDNRCDKGAHSDPPEYPYNAYPGRQT